MKIKITRCWFGAENENKLNVKGNESKEGNGTEQQNKGGTGRGNTQEENMVN